MHSHNKKSSPASRAGEQQVAPPSNETRKPTTHAELMVANQPELGKFYSADALNGQVAELAERMLSAASLSRAMEDA